MSNMSDSFKWLPIDLSPKYPLNGCYRGPSFLARCKDGYIHEVWWSYPTPGSIAYKENDAPKINRVSSGCIVHEHPTSWFPILTDEPLDNG